MLQKGNKLFQGKIDTYGVDLINSSIANNSQRFLLASNKDTLQNVLSKTGIRT